MYSSIATSINGKKWTSLTPNTNYGNVNNASGVAYGIDNNGIGRWVVVGGGSNSNVIATSTNGTDWTDVPPADLGGLTMGLGIKYANGRWIALGTGSKIVYSVNGTTWQSPPGTGNLIRGYAAAYGLSYGTGVWVAVGEGADGTGSVIAKSLNNGGGWSAISNANCGGITTGLGVAYGNGRWVVVGYGTGIATSIDEAFSWQAVPLADRGGITIGYDVQYDNGLWVVVGDGSHIATSTNGTSWNAVPAANLGDITNGKAVAFNQYGV